jgi:hypothetical protein
VINADALHKIFSPDPVSVVPDVETPEIEVEVRPEPIAPVPSIPEVPQETIPAPTPEIEITPVPTPIPEPIPEPAIAPTEIPAPPLVVESVPEIEIAPVPTPIPEPMPEPVQALESKPIVEQAESSIPSAIVGGAVNLYQRERNPLSKVSRINIEKVLKQLEFAIEERNGKLLDTRFFKVVTQESVLDKIYYMKQKEFDRLGGLPPAELTTTLRGLGINPDVFIKWRNYFVQQPLYRAEGENTIGENLSSAAEEAIVSGSVKT